MTICSLSKLVDLNLCRGCCWYLLGQALMCAQTDLTYKCVDLGLEHGYRQWRAALASSSMMYRLAKTISCQAMQESCSRTLTKSKSLFPTSHEQPSSSAASLGNKLMRVSAVDMLRTWRLMSWGLKLPLHKLPTITSSTRTFDS